MSIDAMKRVIDRLEYDCGGDTVDSAVDMLRSAITEAERVVTIGHKTYVQQGGYLMGEAEQQGPVAWGRDDGTYITNAEHNELLHHDNWAQGFDTAFYTTPQPAIPAWQPIETAPRDGTVILLCRVHPNPDVRIAVSDGQWLETSNGHWDWVWPYIRKEPTHWMPLPAAPKEMK